MIHQWIDVVLPVDPRGDESDDDIPGRDAEALSTWFQDVPRRQYKQLKYPMIIVEHRLSYIIIDIYIL